MARVFPEKIPAGVSLEIARTHRSFKKLPDDFCVWFSVLADRDPAHKQPHFLIVYQQKFAFLVQVAATSQELAESVTQSELFQSEQTIEAKHIGENEVQILREFSSQLAQSGNTNMPLHRMVVFPNVKQNTLDTLAVERGDMEVKFLCLKSLNKKSFSQHLSKIAHAQLDRNDLHQLRQHFAPESVIPESVVARSPLAPKQKNTQVDRDLNCTMLDLDQEWCVKNNLYLPDPAEKIAQQIPEGDTAGQSDKNRQGQLVTGVAGCGKSLILLYRAMLNAKLNPSARVLVLTHNRPINNELRRKFTQLDGHAKNIQWLTFFQWASRCIGRQEESVIGPHRCEQLLAEICEKSDSNFTSSFLLDEIGFIKDHSLRHENDYLEISRAGRGTSLQASQRKQVWQHFREYQHKLNDRKLIDWHGVAMRFHIAATTGKLDFPKYDCILIDEAQFFAKSWLDIVRLAIKPHGQLFISADPTQGFLKRRQSWLSSGIDIRGRTTRLRQAYRNSQSVLKFARLFLLSRNQQDADDIEDLNIPSQEQIDGIELVGREPSVIYCPTLQDCHLRAAKEIAQLRQNGHPYGQLLVLHTKKYELDQFANLLGKLLDGAHHLHFAERGPQPANAFCQLSTINAATGLEASTVFILGIDALLDLESSPLLDNDELQDLHQKHTRQIYMAITRASQNLVIISNDYKRSKSLEKLAKATDQSIQSHLDQSLIK